MKNKILTLLISLMVIVFTATPEITEGFPATSSATITKQASPSLGTIRRAKKVSPQKNIGQQVEIVGCQVSAVSKNDSSNG